MIQRAPQPIQPPPHGPAIDRRDSVSRQGPDPLALLVGDLRGVGRDLVGVASIRGEQMRRSLRRAVWTVVAMVAGVLCAGVLAVVACIYLVRGLAGALSDGVGLPGWVGSLGAGALIILALAAGANLLRRRAHAAALDRVRRMRARFAEADGAQTGDGSEVAR